MGRIEVSLDEYNAMNTRIKDLEEVVIKHEKEIELNNALISSLKEIALFFINLSFVERVFKWKQIMKNVEKGIYE